MSDPQDFNQSIIAEFRANEGRVGGLFEGMPVLLLHHVGARSGTERVNPLVYQPRGDSFAIFASKGGAPTNPDWFHNLVANPDIEVEVGAEQVPVRARVTEGTERNEIWQKQKVDAPQFAGYEASAGERVIPVVVLDRR